MTAQPYTDQAIFQNSTQTSSLSWSPPLIPLAHFSLQCHPLFANLLLSQNLHISLPAFFTPYSAINSRVGTVVMIIISSELSITHGLSIQKSICGIKWLWGQIGIKMKIHYFLKIVIARYLWLFSRGVSVKTISVYLTLAELKSHVRTFCWVRNTPFSTLRQLSPQLYSAMCLTSTFHLT